VGAQQHHANPRKQEGTEEKQGGEVTKAGRSIPKPTLSRREFLGASLVAGTALLAESCSTPTTSRTSCPPDANLNDIEHVIILMIENRSFDHFYGTYPGVKGFADHKRGDLGAFSQPWNENTFNPPKGELLPYHLNTAVGNASVIGNVNVPTHNWAPQHMSWAGGKMNAFVTAHALQHYDTPAYAPLVMGYYKRSDLPFWYALADQFTIADNYYCSVLGPTMPNRLYAMSASIDPAGVKGGPILTTPNISGAGSSAQFIFSCSWTTMFERLESQGISWKVYQQPDSSIGPLQSLNLAIAFNALLYFKQYQDPHSTLYKKAFLPSWPDEFERDIA
jgi:Tat (twin-arginine translocation) pathway signal sequence